jgi:hypothetical protein
LDCITSVAGKGRKRGVSGWYQPQLTNLHRRRREGAVSARTAGKHTTYYYYYYYYYSSYYS